MKWCAGNGALMPSVQMDRNGEKLCLRWKVIVRLSDETSVEVIRLKPIVVAAGNLGLVHSFQAEVDISGVQGLAIRPLEARTQVERPRFEISTDTAVGKSGKHGHDARVDVTGRIANEEWSVQGLVNHVRERFCRGIGNERVRLFIQVVDPGAALDRGATT